MGPSGPSQAGRRYAAAVAGGGRLAGGGGRVAVTLDLSTVAESSIVRNQMHLTRVNKWQYLFLQLSLVAAKEEYKTAENQEIIAKLKEAHPSVGSFMASIKPVAMEMQRPVLAKYGWADSHGSLRIR